MKSSLPEDTIREFVPVILLMCVACAVALTLVVLARIDDHALVLREQLIVLNTAEVEGGEQRCHDAITRLGFRQNLRSSQCLKSGSSQMVFGPW